jgi:hypothetical protein
MTFTPLIQRALNKAAALHSEHDRKGLGLPYIVHPVAVACLVSEYTEDETVVAAALLHDTVEDAAGYTVARLEKEFGQRIAGIVDGLTERYAAGTRFDSWLARKREYLERLAKAPPEVLLICAADKLHNIQSLAEAYRSCGENLFSSFSAPKDIQVLFFELIADTLARKIPPRLEDELRQKIIEAKFEFSAKQISHERLMSLQTLTAGTGRSL